MKSLQTASLEEIRHSAARLCREYLTGSWKTVTVDEIIVKRISGGLSNFLYYVSLPIKSTLCCESDAQGNLDEANIKNRRQTDLEAHNKQELCNEHKEKLGNTIEGSPPQEVLLRVYGQTHGENALEAMISESVIFALLSERNFGPKLYGIFPGGRIEQYIQARPLVTRELSNQRISMKIAEKMAEIHTLNIPMSKEPVWVWNCMDRWIRNIQNILNYHVCEANKLNTETVRSFDFGKEAMWLKSVIQNHSNKVVFCHNDLQEGNILLREPSPTATDSLNNSQCIENETTCGNTADPDLVIIDFEYCAYNYRGFDLANHFLEWTFDYNYSNFPFFCHCKQFYPTKQQRRLFIVSYLNKLHENEPNFVPKDEDIESIEIEVQIFSMFSHLFWSLWSVVNVTSNIEFGYWDYAVSRINEFKRLQKEYLMEKVERSTIP